LQSLWKNEGNPKNIMVEVTEDGHAVIAIDQCLTCIQDETLLNEYRDKVVKIVVVV
jgi:hypothetical protein